MGMLLFVAFLFNCLKRWTFLDGFTKVHLLLHLCKCNVLCKLKSIQYFIGCFFRLSNIITGLFCCCRYNCTAVCVCDEFSDCFTLQNLHQFSQTGSSFIASFYCYHMFQLPESLLLQLPVHRLLSDHAALRSYR